MREIRVLNLGGGHGSAPLVGMELDGVLQYDVAVWADTQDEPAWVLRQIEWLEAQVAKGGGAPIVRVTAGSLVENLRSGINNSGGRFVSIPAFSRIQGEVVMTRRQCTREYKIEPVEKYIRRELLGLSPGQHIPRGVRVVQLFGFSVDEASRAARMRKEETERWRFEFPLFHDDVRFRKSECRDFMSRWCTEFEWRWSACRSCPYLSDAKRLELAAVSPVDAAAAEQTDRLLRADGSRCNVDREYDMFLHRSCVPLEHVDLSPTTKDLFEFVCESGCLT